MKTKLEVIGTDKDLKTLAGIICNRVRIDGSQTDIVHLLTDGYSGNNLQAVERWLRSELWMGASDMDPVKVPALSDRLLKQLVDAQVNGLWP